MPKLVLGKSFRFSLNHSTVKLQAKLGRWLHLYCLLALAPNVRTMGVLSRVRGDEFNRHMLFLDYDDCMEAVVRRDVLFAQRQYDAGTAVILRSGGLDTNVAGELYGNFHAIFPAKFGFAEVHEIVTQTHTDFNFREVPVKFNHRAYVLRIWPKETEGGKVVRDRPVFHRFMLAPTHRESNTAMYDFLRKWYSMPVWPPGFAPNLDGLAELSVLDYTTTMGWKTEVREKLKSLWSNKMHMRGVK